MFQYILKRLLAGFMSLFVLITVTFFLLHAIPGGPFSPAEERRVSPKVIEMLNEKYGLNDPVHVQYVKYLGNLIKGDLGTSFLKPEVTVNKKIAYGFPVSAKVGTLSILFSVPLGIIIGILSAIYKDSPFDWLIRAFSTLGVSIPSFLVAVLFLYFGSYYFGVKAYGLGSAKQYVFPVISLSLPAIAYIGRLMRSNMLETLGQDYIRTARAKGVSEFWVIVKHAVKNSVTAVITYVGTLIAVILTGSFVVERLFSIPGIGRDFVSSISTRDYSVVLGITIFFGALLILCNIIVDILYVVIDPRVKYDD